MIQANTQTMIFAGSAITAGAGIALGVDGGKRMAEAERHINLDESRYEVRHAAHLAEVDRTNEALHAFRRTQDIVKRDVIARIHDFIDARGAQILADEDFDFDISGGLSAQTTGVTKLDSESTIWIPGIAAFRFVGDATPDLLKSAIGRYSTASTGKPIRELSGAAAEKAIRAAAGGGSKESGGGGMQHGDNMFKMAKVSAYVFVGGAKIKFQGIKAQAAAGKHRAAIDEAIALLDTRDSHLVRTQKHIADIDEILVRLTSQVTGEFEAFEAFEAEDFDVAVHGRQLQSAMFLVAALQKLASVQVLDEDGNLHEGIAPLINWFSHREPQAEGCSGT